MEDFNKCLKELHEELCNAKSKLNVLNDSIRRVVGRPVGIEEVGHDVARYYSVQRQKPGKSVFNRLSIPRDETKLRLGSRVIRDFPTRKEVLDAQGSDLESKARNRRMFGSLLGTLHKFCQEESRLKEKEDKKAQIEKKLEEQQFVEREMLRKERDLLLFDQKQRQSTIKNLELKIDLLRDFTVIDKSVKNFRYSIRTKTKPFIYYRPYILSKKTERLISNTGEILDTEMKDRKHALNNELKIVDLEYKSSTDSFKSQEKADELLHNGYSLAMQNGIRNEASSKENKSKNLIEPALSSSIVVVNRS